MLIATKLVPQSPIHDSQFSLHGRKSACQFTLPKPSVGQWLHGSRLWSARSGSLGLLIVDIERLQQAQMGCTAIHLLLTAQHPVKRRHCQFHLQQQTSYGRALSHICALKHRGKGENQSASTPSAHKLSVSEQNHEYFSQGGEQEWLLNGQQSISAGSSTKTVATIFKLLSSTLLSFSSCSSSPRVLCTRPPPCLR